MPWGRRPELLLAVLAPALSRRRRCTRRASLRRPPLRLLSENFGDPSLLLSWLPPFRRRTGPITRGQRGRTASEGGPYKTATSVFLSDAATLLPVPECLLDLDFK